MVGRYDKEFSDEQSVVVHLLGSASSSNIDNLNIFEARSFVSDGCPDRVEFKPLGCAAVGAAEAESTSAAIGASLADAAATFSEETDIFGHAHPAVADHQAPGEADALALCEPAAVVAPQCLTHLFKIISTTQSISN